MSGSCGWGHTALHVHTTANLLCMALHVTCMQCCVGSTVIPTLPLPGLSPFFIIALCNLSVLTDSTVTSSPGRKASDRTRPPCLLPPSPMDSSLCFPALLLKASCSALDSRIVSWYNRKVYVDFFMFEDRNIDFLCLSGFSF